MPSISLDLVVALRTLLLDEFLNENLIDNPKHEQKINELVKLTFNIMHKLSTHPFCTQMEIIQEFSISKDVLIKLNTVLRNLNWIQHLITKMSIASKYWKNTIFPLVQSGYLNSVLNKTYEYPYRIGIYPGVSCMFFCSFCGRNNTAKYPKESINVGSEYFKHLFINAPKNDPYRFYISGGLEPLTNPNIGDIITIGASEGFKLSIYTNGFMLTPQLLEKQPGIWNSDTVRISIYGVDAETTFEVTKNSNAYEKVLKNAKSFLKLRNEKNSELKIGFNFVLLKDKVDEILQLAEMIAEINREAGTNRQIDFLTLREDYSVSDTMGISNEERIKLISVFKKFDDRLKKSDLCDLYVDYGYSLEALRLGNPNYTMEMVSYQDIRVKGYPQISIVTDLYKDIYLYREAGFIERQGAKRYILGRVENNSDFETILQNFIDKQDQISIEENDTDYFDIFDHVVTKLLNKIESDIKFGISPEKGPISSLIFKENSNDINNSNTLSHKLLTHFAIENVD
jgi:dTDP-4-amino-4,6-dideoxy-D-glucose ammonia-lyase